MKLKPTIKEQKIQIIKDLLSGKITAKDLDDKIEVFRENGEEVAFKVNNKFVSRDEFVIACQNNPKNPKHIAEIIVHTDEERFNGPLPDEYYV